MIPVLNVTPLGYYADGRTPYFDFGCTYPNVSVLETSFTTKEEAYADAKKWCREFERQDSVVNMATALGVAEVGGKFRGVVNFYSSDT